VRAAIPTTTRSGRIHLTQPAAAIADDSLTTLHLAFAGIRRWGRVGSRWVPGVEALFPDSRQQGCACKFQCGRPCDWRREGALWLNPSKCRASSHFYPKDNRSGPVARPANWR
jgi:hypothetical protein